MLCGAGSKDIVEELIKAGASVTAAAVGGATPLHAAAEAGALDLVLLLLQVSRLPDSQLLWHRLLNFAYSAFCSSPWNLQRMHFVPVCESE